jgi:small subunit ribosomal protein S20
LAKHKSAEKRNKQELKRFERNRAVKTSVKTVIKTVREAVSKKNGETAKTALAKAIPALAKAAAKGAIHKSNAARRISRLTKLVNAEKL